MQNRDSSTIIVSKLLLHSRCIYMDILPLRSWIVNKFFQNLPYFSAVYLPESPYISPYFSIRKTHVFVTQILCNNSINWLSDRFIRCRSKINPFGIQKRGGLFNLLLICYFRACLKISFRQAHSRVVRANVSFPDLPTFSHIQTVPLLFPDQIMPS